MRAATLTGFDSPPLPDEGTREKDPYLSALAEAAAQAEALRRALSQANDTIRACSELLDSLRAILVYATSIGLAPVVPPPTTTPN